MTLRDAFALGALPQAIRIEQDNLDRTARRAKHVDADAVRSCAEFAYLVADAMLKAREEAP